MRTSTAVLIAFALLAPSAALTAQQAPAKGADIAGTWVINVAKSDLGPMPAPTIDSSTITRNGNVYEVVTTSDFGGQGTQRRVLKWPVGEGEASNDMSNGAMVHTTTRVLGDTTTFSSTIAVQGQTVALQTGRTYLSPDGKTLIREMEIQPMAGPSTDPIHFRLVYDRK
jgi:hypothetical protein